MQRLHRQQHLGRGTLIHCLIALGGFVDRQFQIEDLTGLNLTLINQVNQGRQVFTNRCGASFKMNLFAEENIGTDRAVVGARLRNQCNRRDVRIRGLGQRPAEYPQPLQHRALPPHR